jgi:hypothetical protein
LEEHCLSVGVIIQFRNNECHKVAIHQEICSLDSLKDIILHLGEIELPVRGQEIILSHLGHARHPAAHHAHHLILILLHLLLLNELVIFSIRHSGHFIHQLKGVRAAQASDEVPRRDILHLGDNFRALLSLGHQMTLDPLIGIVEVSELVLRLLFAKAAAENDV